MKCTSYILYIFTVLHLLEQVFLKFLLLDTIKKAVSALLVSVLLRVCAGDLK